MGNASDEIAEGLPNMSFLKSIAGALDPQVNAFTTILQKKRGMQIGPDGSAQGWFYRLGSDAAGNAMSPEAALARILKEWTKLQRSPLPTQLAMIELRAMGNTQGYPDNINSIEEWIGWRLPLAFPNHPFHPDFGWTPEFYQWAVARAREHF